ncbi:MAG: tRNA modification GTPase MnmE [candidate division TA06 bacterium 32_111]|uniref:tRNA modification GTPase MnmE n=2 Tax=Bacteria candidate phyla TaxID=1783234 RepID=A0A117M6J0_UNCT6|nr:MAG: tRNA modification GTPase MnmE [candidate division TA06 bacterium 32_111]KUK87067.1 MAG: tRNA modification GTPase MnmE [candidate division TA06 bacterium 34_109]HAF07651.1 tRNA uridine-5-carboxymethylaminomethyl(34) synthesis GTPase MnmE [candidate division WOR-3 bacterium]HCP17439.1 tRNA uridine-5-carboxymethylaminomethyl(34) synthesis GTPase MnmE [candidate division WOR-3 bacterium]
MGKNDTIFAPITLVGNSSITVVRISGPKTFETLKKITSIKRVEHHKIYVEYIKFEEKIYDHSVIATFLSPQSYTGEDMAEISLHGGYAALETFLKLLKSLKLREAERGEFTRRAFLNGKIDLIQAESVLQIINSKTEKSLFLSVKNEMGEFSKKIKNIRENFLSLKSYVQSSIDFPDDVEWSYDSFKKGFEKVKVELESLKRSISSGRIMDRGIKAVIIGRSNTGKSTLFNRMLKEERAIVSEYEGTTRDFISEWIDLNGVPVNLTDGCGIRDTKDPIEKKGIELVLKKVESSDIVIFVFDLSKGFVEEDKRILDMIKSKDPIIVGNKSDISNDQNFEGIKISALTGENLNRLNEEIFKRINFSDETIIVSTHQYNVIEKMFDQMQRIENLNSKKEPEIIDYHLKNIIDGCDILLGKITDENILNEIFSNFCIGK